MIVVWILSYFAMYMLGIITMAVAAFIVLHTQEKKITKTEAEMIEHAHSEDRLPFHSDRPLL